jgi:glutaconate CoA-transferase, subunit A
MSMTGPVKPGPGQPPAPTRNTPLFVPLKELASLIEDGQVIGVGGLHFARLPLALVRAIIELGRKNLDYISWGGGLPLELLLAAGSVKKIAFCFSSLDIFGLAPLFRKALEEKTVEVEEWTALGMIQGFAAAQQGLPSLPFQLPVGSEMMERAGFARSYADPVSGAAVGAARALNLDICLLHAQRADQAGNVEIQGARGLDFSLVGAARRVLVTVEEVVAEGTFQSGPRAFILPRSLVTAIAVVPQGAYPASCLPYYVTDYRALLEATQSVPVKLPAPTTGRLQFVRRAAGIPAHALKTRFLPLAVEPDFSAPPTADEQMVVTLARFYNDTSICAAGAVSPLAMVSYLLAKRLYAPHMLITTMSSGLVDVAVRPMTLTLAELQDFQSAVLHCGGDDTYHWFYQPGYVTHEVVSAGQIDRFGRANNIEINLPGRGPLRLPGQGGMADVANFHHNFLLYLTRHSPRTLVEQVDYASAGRGLLSEAERAAAGFAPGYVRLVTNLAVFQLNLVSHEFELVSRHPGVSLEQVQEATGFPLRLAAQTGITEPPTRQELELLRGEIDPLGLRRLEFVAGRERYPFIAELLDREEAALAGLPGTPD